MEIIATKIDGHEIKITPMYNQETHEVEYHVQLGDVNFTMVLVELDYKIVNPSILPRWVPSLENKLSDLIFSAGA